MNRIEMGVLAEETDGQNFELSLSFDGDFHTIQIVEKDEAWRFTFDFHDRTAEYVLDQMERIVHQLHHYIEADVGGPTREARNKAYQALVEEPADA